MIPRLRINNFIRSPEVQVIGADGKPLGVMKVYDAQRTAREQQLDLVEVGPQAVPPICRIMDYGKYQYQKSKEAKSRPKVKEQLTKAVRVGFKTGAHDLAFKAKKADEFLEEGHIVKVELTLRGREKAFAEKGREKLLVFVKMLQTPITTQGEPKRGPYGWVQMVMKDKKTKPKHEQGIQDKQGTPEAR